MQEDIVTFVVMFIGALAMIFFHGYFRIMGHVGLQLLAAFGIVLCTVTCAAILAGG